MAASRAGSRAMIAARSLSSKPIQPAISSTERPQPTHSPETGCSAQSRLHGVLKLASIVLIGPQPGVATTISGPSKSRQCAAKIINECRKSPPCRGCTRGSFVVRGIAARHRKTAAKLAEIPWERLRRVDIGLGIRPFVRPLSNRYGRDKLARSTEFRGATE
jgi:hypothetical protein